MAEETDPATVALLRDLHREMNGLTRHRQASRAGCSQALACTSLRAKTLTLAQQTPC